MEKSGNFQELLQWCLKECTMSLISFINFSEIIANSPYSPIIFVIIFVILLVGACNV